MRRETRGVRYFAVVVAAVIPSSIISRLRSSASRVEGANLVGVHLEGTDLTDAIGLSEAQLAEAHGDAATQLPAGLARPAHWPDADAGPEPGGLTA